MRPSRVAALVIVRRYFRLCSSSRSLACASTRFAKPTTWPQRRSEIVGDGIAERLELLVRRLEFRRAVAHAHLQLVREPRAAMCHAARLRQHIVEGVTSTCISAVFPVTAAARIVSLARYLSGHLHKSNDGSGNGTLQEPGDEKCDQQRRGQDEPDNADGAIASGVLAPASRS